MEADLVCAKRLEKGVSPGRKSGDAQGKVILNHEELSLLLVVSMWQRPKHKRGNVSPEGHAAA